MYTQLGLYIDGKWNHGNGGGGEDVINPATEKPLAHLPHATQGRPRPCARRRREGLSGVEGEVRL